MTSALLSWYLDNAIAIFAACILTAVAGEKMYRWVLARDLERDSTITSVVSGGAFLIAKNVVGKLFFVGLALWVYENHRIATLDLMNPLVWVGVFVMRDFIYYWVHRMEHTVNVFWASHVVHHSPETIGVTTAIRVPWMEALYKPFFGLWLPLIGFNPLAAVAMDVFAATFAQIIHTEAISARSTRCLETVFVTPSAHRVHHGYNPEYIDKNFGAVFIVWDRLFGTYEPEIAAVKFGVGKNDAVRTPVEVLKGGYPKLANMMKHSSGAEQKAQVLLGRPGGPVPDGSNGSSLVWTIKNARQSAVALITTSR